MLVGAACVLAACARPGPPSDVDDLCRIFAERPGWHDGAARAHLRWGVPPATQLAIVHQESRFHYDARPRRRQLLGFIPLPRRSSAYGFGQVKTGTWREYVAATGREDATRDRFGDVADFIGWYARQLESRAGVPPADVYRLYLAYHEGPTGFRRATYEAKPWLLDTARRVAHRAALYSTQYGTCAS